MASDDLPQAVIRRAALWTLRRTAIVGALSSVAAAAFPAAFSLSLQSNMAAASISASADARSAAQAAQGEETHRHRHRAPAAESGAQPPAKATVLRWYLTMHDTGAKDPATGQEGVFRFDAAGKPLGGSLGPVPSDAGELQDLRGMLPLADGSLLVIAAWKHDTQILRFGPPGRDGRRPFVGVFSRHSDSNPLLLHPYAMAVGPDGSIYVSNQDSNTVTRYGAAGSADQGRPLGRDGKPESGGSAPGLVVPSRDMDPHGVKEIRGIAFAPDGTLLVADRGKGEVTRWDPARGKRLGVLASRDDGVETPIQLLVAPDGRTLLISDNKRDGVYAVDLAGGRPRLLVGADDGIDAASALAVADGWLYVGSRKGRAIVRLRIDGAAGGGAIAAEPFVSELPDNPEFLVPVREDALP